MDIKRQKSPEEVFLEHSKGSLEKVFHKHCLYDIFKKSYEMPNV